jgi:alpha-tubulin suppressor-like RCC1 family protein
LLPSPVSFLNKEKIMTTSFRMKNILLIVAVLCVPMAYGASLQTKNVVGGIIIPFIESLDQGVQLVQSQTTLAVVQAELVATQTELAQANVQIDTASLLLSGTAVPDAAAIDALVSQLIDVPPYPGVNPSSPLLDQINLGLIPWLQATLTKLGNLSGIKQIAAGVAFTVVLTNDGVIYCCGANDFGQLGIGSTASPQTTLTPMNLAGICGTPEQLAAGGVYTLVLTNNGNIYGCGRNLSGELGIGSIASPQTTLTLMHSPVGGFSGTPEQVAAGDRLTLVLTNNGTIYGCGENGDGELGIGSIVTPQTTLTLMHSPLGGFSGAPEQLAAGDAFTIVLTNDGSIYGCGRNDEGQLGIGSIASPQTTLTLMHSPVGGFSGTPEQLAAGDRFTLALTNDGTIYGCGDNSAGQLGIVSIASPQTTLTLMHSPAGGFSGTPEEIEAGVHTLVLTNDGTVYGCGTNFNGQLGIGNQIDQSTLTPMHSPTGGFSGTPEGITAGRFHSLVLTNDGTIYGCGKNTTGQLGIGSTASPQTTLTPMNPKLVTRAVLTAELE